MLPLDTPNAIALTQILPSQSNDLCAFPDATYPIRIKNSDHPDSYSRALPPSGPPSSSPHPSCPLPHPLQFLAKVRKATSLSVPVSIGGDLLLPEPKYKIPSALSLMCSRLARNGKPNQSLTLNLHPKSLRSSVLLRRAFCHRLRSQLNQSRELG